MYRYIVVFAIAAAVSTASVQRAFSQDDVERTLTRAQTLYYEARFKDSVELLLPVDAMFRQRTDRVSFSISVKLQLALGYIGQNKLAEAKSVLQEVSLLDPEYVLDAAQFSPKVLALFDDAKAEQKKTSCENFCREVDRLSRRGDSQALIRLAKEAGPGCACGATTDAAELLYKEGVDAYKQNDFAQAIEKLHAALRFRPQHELAIQYSELAEGRIKLTVDRLLLDWRRYFETQDFSKASGAYRQIVVANIQGSTDAMLQQIRAEYRKAVSSRIDSWSQACPANPSASPDALRQQTIEMLPDQSIAADLVSKLSPCPPSVAEAPIAAEATAPPQGCIQMSSQVAMARLKSRVNPDIRADRVPVNRLSLHAKIRIDENGGVTVKQIDGTDPYINEAMRAAIEKWKFLPTIIENRSRCAETDLPIDLGRS